MTEAITGGCQCGQVRYIVNAPAVTQLVCHCNGCLRRTGPYTGLLFVKKEALELSGDCNVYPDIGNSGYAVDTYRCSTCGSYIGSRAEAVPLMWLVAAASLDDEDQFKPVAHNWVSSKPYWVSIVDKLPRFERALDWNALGGRPDFGSPPVRRKKGK